MSGWRDHGRRGWGPSPRVRRRHRTEPSGAAAARRLLETTIGAGRLPYMTLEHPDELRTRALREAADDVERSAFAVLGGHLVTGALARWLRTRANHIAREGNP